MVLLVGTMGFVIASSAAANPRRTNGKIVMNSVLHQPCEGLVKGAPWTEALRGREHRPGAWEQVRRLGWVVRPFMRLRQVEGGMAFTSTYAPGASTRPNHQAPVPHQPAVAGVSQIALGMAADGRGWLLDNGQRSNGSLLLLAAAPVIQDHGGGEAATSSRAFPARGR